MQISPNPSDMFARCAMVALLVTMTGFCNIAMAQISAAKVMTVAGSAKVIGPQGQERTVAKGAEIFSGEKIITADGALVQIRLNDGGYMSVRPNTEIVLDRFVYDENDANKSSFLVSLVRGGFRSITGLIGRSNPNAYQIRTSTATVGIRGTDHEPMFIPEIAGVKGAAAPGLYDKVNDGETFITNKGGLLSLKRGDIGFSPLVAVSAPQVLTTVPDFYKVEIKTDARDPKDAADAKSTDSKGSQPTGIAARPASTDSKDSKGAASESKPEEARSGGPVAGELRPSTAARRESLNQGGDRASTPTAQQKDGAGVTGAGVVGTGAAARSGPSGPLNAAAGTPGEGNRTALPNQQTSTTAPQKGDLGTTNSPTGAANLRPALQSGSTTAAPNAVQAGPNTLEAARTGGAIASPLNSFVGQKSIPTGTAITPMTQMPAAMIAPSNTMIAPPLTTVAPMIKPTMTTTNIVAPTNLMTTSSPTIAPSLTTISPTKSLIVAPTIAPTIAPSISTVSPTPTMIAPTTTLIAPTTALIAPTTKTIAPTTTLIAPTTTTLIAPTTTLIAPTTTTLIAPTTTLIAPTTTTLTAPTTTSTTTLIAPTTSTLKLAPTTSLTTTTITK